MQRTQLLGHCTERQSSPFHAGSHGWVQKILSEILGIVRENRAEALHTGRLRTVGGQPSTAGSKRTPGARMRLIHVQIDEEKRNQFL